VQKETPDRRAVYHGIPIRFSMEGAQPALGGTGILEELPWSEWADQVI
jgi:hypothetical protein